MIYRSIVDKYIVL